MAALVFRSTSPEEALKAEAVPAYGALQNDIWERLIQINDSLVTLERMQEYPLDYIAGPGEFWRTLHWNYLYIACVFLHGLLADQSNDAHTLPKFRDRIYKDWIRDEYRG
jgi:hypothetical protein